MIPIFKDRSIQEQFERDGYATMPFLSEAALLELRKFCTTELDYLGKGFYHVFLNNDLTLRNRVVAEIKGQFEEPMDAVFHESTFIYGSFTIKEPGPNGVKNSHQDWALTDETQYPSLTLWCPLSDVDEQNGCLGVLEGSHKLTSNIRGVNIPSEYEAIAPNIEASYLKYIPMKAGEAIIFDSRVVHYSPENLSDTARLVAACVFVPKKDPSLRMYYKDPENSSTKLELFEVDSQYLISRDYYDTSRPEQLKSLGHIDYDSKILTKADLEDFISNRLPASSDNSSTDEPIVALSTAHISKQYSGNDTGSVGENWALKDITFGLEKGDVLGLFGPNGSGKSTLLKILSEVAKPTEGTVEYFGNLMAILELGTGFHPDLTGSENIYFNGRMLGMSKREIQSKYEDIVAFSGVGDYIDSPLKYYSSGMYSRLAFSVFAHMEPDILLLDEVFSTGDEEFREKSSQKILEMAAKGTTIILVSHNMDELFTVCNRYAYMEEGAFTDLGTSATKVYDYLKGMLLKRNASGNGEDPTNGQLPIPVVQWSENDEINQRNKNVRLQRLEVMAANKKATEEISITDDIHVRFTYKVLNTDREFDVAFALLDIFNHELMGDATAFHSSLGSQFESGVFAITWKIKGTFLNSGIYKLNLRVRDENKKMLFKLNHVIEFEIKGEANTSDDLGYSYPIRTPSTLEVEAVEDLK